MKKPIILRKRYIPDEVVDISGDELLFRNEDLIITRWKAIKPRNDISGGISWTFIRDGYKVSRFFNLSGEFLYWYCDIINSDYESSIDRYIFSDLLVDVRIMNDGSMQVLDIDELADAAQKGLISQNQLCLALRRLHAILDMIYKGEFPPRICREKTYYAD